MLCLQISNERLCIAIGETRAFYAVTPDFPGEVFPGAVCEPTTAEEVRYSGQNKNLLHPKESGILQAILDDLMADTLALMVLAHNETSEFGQAFPTDM